MANKSSSANIDLVELFSAVASSLGDKRETLNQADTYNHDHGDHMVEIFEVVTQAMQEKKNADPADQLAHASELLRQRQSGSAQVYASGFSQASEQFKDRSVTMENAGMLLQTLLGGGESPNSLARGAGGDMLGSLLGSLTGEASPQKGEEEGLDFGDLLNAGMAFMDAKQQGSSNAEAAVNALMSASPLGQSDHRRESGAMVANTIMQVLSSMSK